ncbi:MAG: molybdate ABC transporter permease subunit [Synechococcaceae cyanobacterium SM2_3_1]|nr:molybdate ABC transporter permease subunit [Synechococcaceae cyanobacterium SM2_3_1]
MESISWSPLWISLQTAATATLIAVIMGTLSAYGMRNYRGKWRSLIDSLLLAPLVLPPTVVGFLLLLLLGRQSPLGQVLSWLGIQILFSWWATVIAATVVAFPLMYRTTLGAFQQIDTNILNAARSLGAGEWRVFLRVVLPLARPGILAGTTLSFARGLGEFGATLMLAGNLPGRTQTIPMAIYFASEGGRFREAWIWVGIILLLSLGGILALNYGGELREPRLPQIRTVQPLASGSATAAGGLPLSVQISRTLPSFQLQVMFTGDQKPLGLLGASGSGKSMTLRCIAGFETPQQGRIQIRDRVVFDPERGINLPASQRHVGFVFQNYALFPHLTVQQNIAFGLQHLPSGDQSLWVQEWIHRMQLKGLEDRYPAQLSGGQQQRVALARALAPQPDVLLLDEPFSALDTHLRSQMERQLRLSLESYAGAVLFVTHNLEEAYRLCPSLLVLDKGCIAAWGSKEEILYHPPTVKVALLTGCKNIAAARKLDHSKLEVPHWGCEVGIKHWEEKTDLHVGIRAHHLILKGKEERVKPESNVFPCWLAEASETPFRMTLYLKLHTPATHRLDYHLQAEIYKEAWQHLQNQPYPWWVHLDPDRLMLLHGNT